MFDHRKTRKYTCAVLDAVDEGMLDKDQLIQDLLGYLSEDEVQDFVRKNDLMPWLEDEEEDEYEDDGQPDEAQEWHDFDPEC